MNDEVRRQWGGSAYPTGGYTDGMTLLDWFAGQALAGLLANDSGGICMDDAQNAYIVAEAMMAERRARIERAKAERIPRPAPDADTTDATDATE